MIKNNYIEDEITKKMFIRRSLLKTFLFLSVFIAVLKLLLLKDFEVKHFFLEIFTFSFSLLGLMIGYIYDSTEDNSNEKVSSVYNFVLWVIYIVGSSIYLILMSLDFVKQYEKNYIYTVMIFLIFFSLYFSINRVAKRNNTYLHLEIITLEKSIYYKKIFEKLASYLMVGVLQFALIIFLNIFDYVVEGYKEILILLAYYQIINILSYLLFAFYEKNTYDELILLENGRQIYVTKNIIVFIFSSAFINILTIVVSNMLVIFHYDQQNFSTLSIFLISGFNDLNYLIRITSLIFSGFTALFLFTSLKKLPKKNTGLLKLLFVGFGISVVSFIMELYFYNIYLKVEMPNPQLYAQYSLIQTIIAWSMSLLSLVLSTVYIIIYDLPVLLAHSFGYLIFISRLIFYSIVKNNPIAEFIRYQLIYNLITIITGLIIGTIVYHILSTKNFEVKKNNQEINEFYN